MGDNYKALNDLEKALSCYNKAIHIDKTYREPYLAAAEICNTLEFYNLAIGYTQEALKNSFRHFSWIERDNSWNEQLYDILSISYYYINELDKALENVNIALNFNDKDSRILLNKEFILRKKEGAN